MKNLSDKKIIIDTNILVRLFIGDDVSQLQQAVNLLETVAEFYVPTTVFVETAWVLIKSYELSKADILTLFTDFVANAEKLSFESDEVNAGLAMLAINGDFADGINQYLGMIKSGGVFVTFDRKAVNKLASLGHHALLLKGEIRK